MKLVEAAKYPFQGQHAWANLGCIALCFMIPIVGPIVAMGYLCGLEKQLVMNLSAEAPKFDFNKFGLYLRRGVAPFVASLMGMLVLIPLLFLIIFAVIAGIAMAKNDPLIPVLLIIVATLTWVLIAMVFGVVMSPITFRSMVEQKIGSAFEMGFLISYYKRVGLLTLGVNLLIMLATLPLLPIMCLPFVQYAIFAVLMVVQSHIRAQLYLLYLERGGEALNIMPDVPEQGFEVLPPAAV